MQREELLLLRKRINVAVYAVGAVLLLLVAGFWHFQIAQSDFYSDLAKKNSLKQIPLIASRGKILDREGRPLVDNRPSYDIVYVREGGRYTLEQLSEILTPTVGITLEEIKERVAQARSRFEPKFHPIVLKEDVDVADIAFIRAHQLEFQEEIYVADQQRRRYLEGNLAAHAIGYLGEVTSEELKRNPSKPYKPGDHIGKSGLELQYDSILRGQDGYRVVMVDKSQREIERLGFEEPVGGHDLRTTIDLDLQRAAEEALGDQVGAAVAIVPSTGEVLVLASKPAFDPNLFATRISATAMQDLNTDPRKPFRNRVIQDRYAPGSVFKIFMAAAGLEAETLSPLDHVSCSGEVSFDGGRVVKHCWKAGGHGPVGLYEAIVNSCNVFFYNVGRKLDIDRIAQYATSMGFGKVTGIDLSGEDKGLIPSREWKARHYKTAAQQTWYPSETLDVSIGQGAVAVTPLQAAFAMGGLASGGRLMQPHLVDPKFLNENGFMAPKLKFDEYHVSAATVDVVSRGMWGVVNEGGTGTRAAVKGFDVAGKTGTAQVVNKKSYGKEEDFEDNAWFVGFAPYRNPEIVVAAFVEHGGHGGTAAAPVAHAIFDTYYRKKTGQFGVQVSGPIAQVKP